MKRDMDLARQILFAVEAEPTPDAELRPEVGGYSAEVIAEHVRLLHEAGLLRAIDGSSMDGLDWIATGLTWNGHEFLDAARDDSRWKRAKELAIAKGGALAFETLKIALGLLLRDAFKADL